MPVTYNVYRDGVQIVSELATTTYTDTELTPETSYEYYVTAQNEYGESNPSTTVTVTTDAPHDPPAEPASLTSTGNTDTEAELDWS